MNWLARTSVEENVAGEEGQADDRGKERTGAAPRGGAAGTNRRSSSGTGRSAAGVTRSTAAGASRDTAGAKRGSASTGRSAAGTGRGATGHQRRWR